MHIHETIKRAIEIALSAGLQKRVDSLWREEISLLEPRYRVAFVGQFKTGKSTLINRLILKERVLFTDILEATAIPTEIDFAENPRLEVYRYEKKSYQIEVDGHKIEQAYAKASIRDRVIENPTIEQIREATSGDTPEARATVANTYSHARIYWPAENLRQFTAVDTPGIDSPNDAVVTTTYRILPNCDVAIFVARPGQLSQVDIQFLQSRVFDTGITRCMVVLHHDPQFSGLTEQQMERIKATVRSQLAQIGRESIEVTAAELPRLEGLPGGGLGEAVISEAQPLENWLGSGSSAKPRSATDAQALSIERHIIRFINENIRPGKEEKIAISVRRIVENALAECQMELTLIEKSEQEREALSRTLKERQQSTARETDDIRQDFLDDLRLLRPRHLLELTKGLDLVERRFCERLKTCESLDEIQTTLRSLRPIVQLEVEDLAIQAAESLRGHFRELEQKYTLRLRRLGASWQEMDVAFEIDGGILERIPGILVWMLDNLLIVILSPLPIFIDIPLRWLASQIPGLDRLLPANLAAELLVNRLQASASAQFEFIKNEVNSQLELAYSEAEEAFSKSWNEQAAEQARIVENVTRRATDAIDPSRAVVLRRAIGSFRSILSQLPIGHDPF